MRFRLTLDAAERLLSVRQVRGDDAVKLAAILGILGLSGCVDAIDRKAEECERIMLPRILAKAKSLPNDEVLRAKNVEIEHWLEGGKERLKAIQAKVRPNWRETDVQPVDEINYALFLTEDAVGFPARAVRRTKELCQFAETNRVKYQKWSYGASGMAGYVSQTPETNIVEELGPE